MRKWAMAMTAGCATLLAGVNSSADHSPSALLPGVKLNSAGQVDMSTGYKAGGSSSDYNGHSVPSNWVAGSKAGALGMPKDMADVLYEIATRRMEKTGRTDPLTRWGQVYGYVIQNECSITLVTQWESWSIEIISHLTTENERLEKAIRELDADALAALKKVLQTLADEVVKRIPGNPGFTVTDVMALMSGNGLPNANSIKASIAGSGDYAGGEGPQMAKTAGLMIDVAVSVGEGNYVDALLSLGNLLGSELAGSLMESLNLGKAIGDLAANLWVINTSLTETTSHKMGMRVNNKLMDWGMAFHTMALDCSKKLKPVTTTPGQRPPKPFTPRKQGDPLSGKPLITPASGGTCGGDRLYIPKEELEVTEGRKRYALRHGNFAQGGCLYAGSKQALYPVTEFVQILAGTHDGKDSALRNTTTPKKSTTTPKKSTPTRTQ